ncbi:hypothetical protein Lal_00033430 [Lupinus albus]|nr:hypothetical protein Lal_00033430 [Lupinus albus]
MNEKNFKGRNRVVTKWPSIFAKARSCHSLNLQTSPDRQTAPIDEPEPTIPNPPESHAPSASSIALPSN